MKNLIILLCLVFVVTSIGTTYAQLSKQEKKEWKKKAKTLKKNPEKLKNLYDENAALKGETSGYKRQISSLEGKLKEKDNQIASMTQSMRVMESELVAAKEQMTARPAGVSYDDSGVVFKVQIGAFRNKDLSKYFDNTENFSGETDDGVQKITLGRFTDYWEADTFKKYLREMGVNDAWIVPFKDGVRVAMKDVLEGVI
jgi:hypothetical protein